MSQSTGAIVSGLHATRAGLDTTATAVEMEFDANGNVTYYGAADPGTNITDPSWQIKKLLYDSNGNLLSVLWANGESNFRNIWANRAALSYS